MVNTGIPFGRKILGDERPNHFVRRGGTRNHTGRDLAATVLAGRRQGPRPVRHGCDGKEHIAEIHRGPWKQRCSSHPTWLWTGRRMRRWAGANES